jgi:predicted RNA methylase
MDIVCANGNGAVMKIRFPVLIVLAVTASGFACRTKYREDLDYSYSVQQSWSLEDLHFGEIVQFETVFWESDDTVSLRKAIVEDTVAAGRDVLEIGTGTGVISILCLQNDASKVVATDINPAAVANARYNAVILVPDQELDVRQVAKASPGAYSVIEDDERFDLIISNPPWEDGVVAKPADHAFYDPGFALMDSLLDGLPKHLNVGGRCLLAYGHVPAIKRLKQESDRRGFEFKILDERDLDSLDVDFLPGMLIEIRLPLSKETVSGGGFTTAEEPRRRKD